MLPYILAGIAAAVLVFWFARRGPSPYALAQKAADSGDTSELIQAANRLPRLQRSKFFQQAIAFLWENFQRPLAAEVVRAFAEHHSNEKICQFWLKQVLEVEPIHARKVFDSRFLKDHYNPEVANTCGCTSS